MIHPFSGLLFTADFSTNPAFLTGTVKRTMNLDKSSAIVFLLKQSFSYVKDRTGSVAMQAYIKAE